MEARTRAKYVRTAPRKMRLIGDMIRGKKVEDATNLLRFTPKRAARLVEKILKTAVANAENSDMDTDNLFVSTVYIDQGPTLKRWRARAMGRAVMIRRKTSHITIVLKEREEE
ncbi:MAG: 50S ribosomal protein L22 [Candidatus Eremiobacterota bacterium]